MCHQQLKLIRRLFQPRSFMTLGCGILMLVLISCGFHLRGTEPLGSVASKTIFIETDAPYSSLTLKLIQRLKQTGAVVVQDPKQASIVFTIHDAILTTKQMSIGSSEYTETHHMIYTVHYTIDAGTHEKTDTLHVQQTVTTLPHETLSNSQKWNETKQWLEEEIITQLLQILASYPREAVILAKARIQ